MALAVAVLAAVASVVVQRAGVNPFGSDFAQVWHGAHALFGGESPYEAVGPTGSRFYWPAPLVYPATALVAVGPLALLPLAWAEAAFVLLGAFALVYGVTRRAWWPLVALASAPSLLAIQFVQWTYLLTASLTLPMLAPFMAAKPTIGAAMAGGAVDRRWWRGAVWGGLGLAIIAFALRPSWPSEWLQALQSPSEPFVASGAATNGYAAPLTLPGGPLVLAALLRWRRPEARLIVTLASVPQTMIGTELLPLVALVPETRLQALCLALLTWMVRLGTGAFGLGTTWTATFAFAGRLSVWLVFLPCTALVLWRRNEGPLPPLPNRIPGMPDRAGRVTGGRARDGAVPPPRLAPRTRPPYSRDQ